MSTSCSTAASASRPLVTPAKVRPSGFSSETAAALRPFTNSRRTRLTGLRMRRAGGRWRPWRAFRARGEARSSGPGGASRARARRSGERLDLGRQAALVSRRLVLVDYLLVGDAIEGARRHAEEARGAGLVAGRDRLLRLLHGAAERGAERGIVLAALLGLAGALARLGGVGHWTRGSEKARIVGAMRGSRKRIQGLTSRHPYNRRP